MRNVALVLALLAPVGWYWWGVEQASRERQLRDQTLQGQDAMKRGDLDAALVALNRADHSSTE